MSVSVAGAWEDRSAKLAARRRFAPAADQLGRKAVNAVTLKLDHSPGAGQASHRQVIGRLVRMGTGVDRGTCGQGVRANGTGRWLVGRLGAGYTHTAGSQIAVASAPLGVRNWLRSDGREHSGLQWSIVGRRCWKRGAASRGGEFGLFRMLTDIFANRYSKVRLWDTVGEPERRLLVQVYRILEEQICPFWIDGKESARGKAFWTDIHNRLSMELGVRSLSPLAYSFESTWAGKSHTNTGLWSMNKVCETWMLKECDNSMHPDTFVKERLSLIEIGFRKREEEIVTSNASLPTAIESAQRDAAQRQASGRSSLRVPGDRVSGLRAMNERLNAQFRNSVNELNARLRNAGCDLNYHNGYIQLSSDSLVLEQVETPFWALVADQKWKNVDTDMKEALDRRDTDARDPAFYAARALESVLKIVSDEKEWTHGKEKGAHNYIDNLAAKRSGFIADWEADALKSFFSKVRNPLGHGPGMGKMPKFSRQQTDWAIEMSMVWIRNLIRRL